MIEDEDPEVVVEFHLELKMVSGQYKLSVSFYRYLNVQMWVLMNQASEMSKTA